MIHDRHLRDLAIHRDAHLNLNRHRRVKTDRLHLKHVTDRFLFCASAVNRTNRAIIAQELHQINLRERFGCIYIFLANQVVAFQRRRSRVRRNAQHILGVIKHLANGLDKRLGGNRRAGNG